MTDLNPVDAMTTPPEKLFAKWEDDILNERENVDVVLDCAWKNGFVAGANQELDACCEWVRATHFIDLDGHDALRIARRPKPPSLKEQALELARAAGIDGAYVTFGPEELTLIRRALEALDD